MTEQERTVENRLQRVGDVIVQREVLLCLSAPVGDWIQNNHEDFSEWCENAYTNPEGWDVDQCEGWLKDRGINFDPIDDTYQDTDDWHDCLRECVIDNAEPAEVYEWWAVSSWLAAYLRENGHVMLDWYGIDVWGRETTGQAISMDGVIRDFIQAKDLVANGWGE